MLERHPQEIAEAHQRAVGRLHVAVHQCRDRMQRVEEEMGLELLPERGHLRGNQPGLELRRADGPVARFAVIEDRVAEPGDGPVRHHLPVDVQQRRPLEFLRPVEGPSFPGREPPVCRRHRTDVRQREQRGRRQVNQHGAHECLPLEPEVLR
jgi:hypothetical protein